MINSHIHIHIHRWSLPFDVSTEGRKVCCQALLVTNVGQHRAEARQAGRSCIGTHTQRKAQAPAQQVMDTAQHDAARERERYMYTDTEHDTAAALQALQCS